MATEHPKGDVRKVMTACFAGQVVEWFDYGLYGLLAAHIAIHFFPSDDPMTGLLSTFAVFGVAFVVRPLGGVVLGRLGDVKGRHYVLVVSILLMTIATTVIGLTPGAAQIGLAAPILLVLARALQGFSTAGESTSSTTYVAESVPEHRKGFYGAILIAGNSAGLLLATATIAVIQALMSEQAFAEWGWRVPFLIAVPMGAIAFYIRRKLEETPDFVRWQEEGVISQQPLKDTFTSGLPQLVQGIGIGAISFIAHYLIMSYLPTHLKLQGVAPDQLYLVMLVPGITMILSYPLLGLLSDRIGRKPVLLLGSGALAALGVPLFALIDPAHPAQMIGAIIGLTLATGAYVCVMGVFYNEFTDPSRRMTTYSAGFNISGALFGGMSLWGFTRAVQATGDPYAPGWILAATALFSFLTLLTVRVWRPN